jgi:hypothetical protein
MTDRDPARRPTADRVATDLHALAAGGDATTVLAAPRRTLPADRTQVLDATRMMTTTAPAPVRAPAPPPRQRNPWPAVMGLVAVVAVLLLAGIYLSQRGPVDVPSPVPVDQSVPQPLRQDLSKLQLTVRQ